MQKKKEHPKTNQSSKIGQSFWVIKFEFCKFWKLFVFVGYDFDLKGEIGG